ncbi:MAG: septation protein SpoVG family protein [Candidatus Omnitrophota bacterium]
MEITEVKIFLKDSVDKKLKGFATITFDNAFVVRNVKLIEGSKGLFVAMPSRKMRQSCPKCGFKNAIRSRFCNQCGAAIDAPPPQERIDPADKSARQSEHRDIAHPITSEFREYIQKKVIEAYDKEKTMPPVSRTAPRSQDVHHDLEDDID